ncbi:hypothetical protein LTR24_010368 [Lithohypha guttulata]|uniref:Impact N-terminal domain-containing protein n=1 Tax=Lithohypha guttulata TaxID=1690604 RepID=A0ABR0JV02_9EURO|nr:hypothetical protein LTR24_010368 [Lithohypha guttulata]
MSYQITKYFNTFHAASINLKYDHQIDRQQLSSLDGNFTLESNADWVISTLKAAPYEPYYAISWPWIVLDVISCAVLLAAAIAAFWLRKNTEAPDIFGYVSSLTRENPRLDPEGGSALSGMERTRKMKHVKVKLGEIPSSDGYGRIGLTYVDDRHDQAHDLEKGKRSASSACPQEHSCSPTRYFGSDGRSGDVQHPSLLNDTPHLEALISRAMALKRRHDDIEHDISKSQQPSSDFESSPVEDRASKFVALFSPDIPPKTLQTHLPYKSATHRILAWRRPSKQQSLIPSPNAPGKMLYDTGCDDDGEKYAGRKLVNLLVDMDVVGAVVVARWYGGVLLGPARFEHIINVAREAIGKWKQSKGIGAAAKKVKVEATVELTPEQEAEQKERLLKQLRDRDGSIKVLRELLAEKQSTLSQPVHDAAAVRQPQGSQDKQMTGPNYAVMPLKILRQLEKARDTTITWILKQIDTVESSNAGKDAEATG